MQDLPPLFWGISIFVFGLIIGSFLNVVIYRVPRGESIVFAGSHCTACDAAIKPYDNIPVVSYLVLGGRCRNCRAHISPLYPIVEFVTGALFLLSFLNHLDEGLSFSLAGDIVFVSLIVPLVFIDLRHKLLPNVITLPGLALMIAARLLVPGPIIAGSAPRLLGIDEWPAWAAALACSAIGAVAGGGTLWLVREAYYRLRRVEGMGLGDVKMMMMVGAYLGWQSTLLTIFIGSLLGSVIGLAVISRGKGTIKMEIPFGVFLGPAAIIALFAGRPLIEWYVGLYR